MAKISDHQFKIVLNHMEAKGFPIQGNIQQADLREALNIMVDHGGTLCCQGYQYQANSACLDPTCPCRAWDP
jgi:hypothetical protein